MAKTVGYDSRGVPREFDLRGNEKLPRGYTDTPPPGAHPHDKDGTNPPVDQPADKPAGE